jgi:hypothetical protein
MSEVTTGYGCLLDGLENCRWGQMVVLADAAEEKGDAALAAGWRWLADNRKWPDEEAWAENWGEYWAVFYRQGETSEGAGRTHELPLEMFDAVARRCGRSMRHHPHKAPHKLRGDPLTDFLLAVARAAGEFLLARKRVVG